jgi:hypothetical protein
MGLAQALQGAALDRFGEEAQTCRQQQDPQLGLHEPADLGQGHADSLLQMNQA